MNTGKTISYLAAGILILLGLVTIFFGVIFIWGTFSPSGQSGWAGIGIVTALVGLGMVGGGIALVYFANKRAAEAAAQNVTLQVDLPGNVAMDTIKCQSCGGVLKPENISMVAGAPVVTCPYCSTTYQLTEEPKW